MMWSERLQRYAQEAYEQRRRRFGTVGREITERLPACTEEERVLMTFLYGTMPLRDVGDVPFDVALGYVRHAVMLRSQVPRCREMDEAIFVKYVFYPRINTEEITDCRGFFYREVKDRIEGLSVERAALEINYYCAEHASYQSTDSRTLAPDYVYAYGTGRCGEESVFTVSVLRAAGIPARQVYVPRWAHCDDNHAWVEFLSGDRWHYMGACEPEEVTDRGWFDGAASRAMMVHTRNFTDYGDEEMPAGERQKALGRRNGTYYYNLTGAYARTSVVRIAVRCEDGMPAAGAEITAELLNMAEYSEIARLRADAEGRAVLRTGWGSLRLAARGMLPSRPDGRQTVLPTADGLNGASAAVAAGSAFSEGEDSRLVPARGQSEPKAGSASAAGSENAGRMQSAAGEASCLIQVQTQTEVVLTLHEAVSLPAEYSTEYLFTAPREEILSAARPTREQEEAGQIRSAACEKSRRRLSKEHLAVRRAHLRNYAGENAQERELTERLLAVLAPKDEKDVPDAVLRDVLDAMSEGEMEVSSREYPREIFDPYVLNQRIYLEQLVPWRRLLRDSFTDQEKAEFRADPRRIAFWVSEHITEEPEIDYDSIYATPIGALRTGHGSELSRRILMTAIARTLGIPARMDPVLSEVQYYDKKAGAFLGMESCGREIRKITSRGEEAVGRAEGKSSGALHGSGESGEAGKRSPGGGKTFFGGPVSSDDAQPDAQLFLTGRARELSYAVDWTIAERTKIGAWQTLRLENTEAGNGLLQGKPLSLRTGTYRILMSARRPDGSQQVKEEVLNLRSGEIREMELVPPQIPLSGLIESVRIEDVDLLTREREETTLLSLMAGRKSLVMFLQPGREPSEHVMNEVMDAGKDGLSGLRLIGILEREEDAAQETFRKLQETVPEMIVCLEPGFHRVPRLARKFYVDPDRLPLMLLFNEEQTGIFGCSGYNAGSVAMALRLSSLTRE